MASPFRTLAATPAPPSTVRRSPATIAADLFGGAGGTTLGFWFARFRVPVAVEHHPHAAATHLANNFDATLSENDIRNIDPASALPATTATGSGIAVPNSCPPCQGFLSLRSGRRNAARNNLVLETARWAKALRPKIVVLENVPQLRHDARYRRLLDALAAAGYRTYGGVVDAADISAPPRRKRLIPIACRDTIASLPESLASGLPSYWPFEHDAGGAIRGLGRVRTKCDPLHVGRKPTPLVRKRLEVLSVGGNLFDLGARLQLACHKSLDKRNGTGSYARIPASGPCGTLTTRCMTPSSGPFAQPRQPRGFSLSAVLQTFLRTYQPVGHYESVERPIGNAVPPRVSAAVARVAWSLL